MNAALAFIENCSIDRSGDALVRIHEAIALSEMAQGEIGKVLEAGNAKAAGIAMRADTALRDALPKLRDAVDLLDGSHAGDDPKLTAVRENEFANIIGRIQGCIDQEPGVEKILNEDIMRLARELEARVDL